MARLSVAIAMPNGGADMARTIRIRARARSALALLSVVAAVTAGCTAGAGATATLPTPLTPTPIPGASRAADGSDAATIHVVTVPEAPGMVCFVDSARGPFNCTPLWVVLEAQNRLARGE
jgi:hypothetical protein